MIKNIIDNPHQKTKKFDVAPQDYLFVMCSSEENNNLGFVFDIDKNNVILSKLKCKFNRKVKTKYLANFSIEQIKDLIENLRNWANKIEPFEEIKI